MSSRARELLFHMLVIVATPFLALAVNPHLFVTAASQSYLDPWIYTGFFLSLPDFLIRWGGTYYSTRISWLMPGYAAHRAFPDSPLVANYLLHFGFFYLLCVSIYALIAAGLSRRAALLSTLLIAWSPVPLAALSWDYPDGAGLAYIAAMLACANFAASCRTESA